MIGLLKSVSRKPTARSIERFGARCTPSVTILLRSFSAIALSLGPATLPRLARYASRHLRQATEVYRRYAGDGKRRRAAIHGRLILGRAFHAAQLPGARARRQRRVRVLP